MANGRGNITLVQSPDASNNYEAIVLLDDDSHGAAAWYEFSLYWTETPPIIPTPTPPGEHYLVWRGILGMWGDSLLEIKGDSVNLLSHEWNEKARAISTRFSESLPEYPVNLSAAVVEGDVTVAIRQQPRAENGFTAQVAIDQTIFDDGVIEIILLWGDQVPPDPTATPIPTFDPNAPTPTPIIGAPKVLWIVMDRAFSNSGSQSDFIEFSEMLTDLGAENDVVIAGEQPITDGLLAGYAAVIFGDTRTVPPLTADEQGCVLRFVRSGGSIFVIGQQDLDYMLEPSAIYASSVAEPFGIRFSTTVGGMFTDFVDHPIFNCVTSLYGAGGSALLVEEPAQALAFANSGEAVLTIADDGYGRVMAYSDEMMFFSSSYWGLENSSYHQFAQNIAAWLLRMEDTNLPPPATPTPTFSPPSTDEDTNALLNKMLQNNKSWLDPISIEATYSLLRTPSE